MHDSLTDNLLLIPSNRIVVPFSDFSHIQTVFRRPPRRKTDYSEFFFLGEKKRNSLFAAKRNGTLSQLRKLYFATKRNERVHFTMNSLHLYHKLNVQLIRIFVSFRHNLIFPAKPKFHFSSPRREIVYFIFRFSSPRNFEDPFFFVADDDIQVWLCFCINGA